MMMMKGLSCHGRTLAVFLAVGLALALVCPTQASATVLDFEFEDDFTTPLVNGQDISTPPEFGNLVSISDAGAGHLGTAVFDSDTGGPNAGGPDPDLLVDLGNILILQSADSPAQTVAGIFDTPNDSATGGSIIVDLLLPSYLISIDLIDINGGGQTDVTRVYDVPSEWTGENTSTQGWDTLDLTTLLAQPGLGTGGSATAVEDTGFDPYNVRKLEVDFSGSGGVDNLTFRTIPEPGTMALLGLGILGLLARRRQR
jgi:hypothetical protein